MAKLFRQRDIDKMQASDVTQEFVNYYNRLSDERRKELAQSRPDLANVVQSWKRNEHVVPIFNDKKQRNNFSQEEIAGKDAIQDVSLSEIANNIYNGKNLRDIVKNDFRPIEALTVADKQNKCPAHRVPFVEYSPKFHDSKGAFFGMKFYHCPECNRLFIKQSEYGKNSERLKSRKIPFKFYDFELSKKYLKTQVKPYELNDEEKIYFLDEWIQEKPTCPIHESLLEKLPCVVKYEDREYSFEGYYCDACQKLILRRVKAKQVEADCAEIGIPLAGFERLEKKIFRDKIDFNPKIKPDYIVEDGEISEFGLETEIETSYRLTESDTVVASDSIYCTLSNHETDEVAGLIWVQEKKSGLRKSYVSLLGYCDDCQKYYMDKLDYKAIYKIGRPEVSVVLDFELDEHEAPYNITSGEVYKQEEGKLESLVKEIENEEDKIKNRSDYKSNYATISGYDDGNLAFDKSVSKKKYGGRLTELYDYKNCPYQYRVDISRDKCSDVYYIGNRDISINNREYAISQNSKFARQLVNYKTIKINKDGKEYQIKLQREFDIVNAKLYGYTNIKTDEDMVFRKGVTDPFLIRALNLRKKQHNLVDIFVTIQENQNTIVDVDFKKNIIVQGCAGSGKTMVMLHRLASLNYERRNFDFNRDALILTPNENFNLHIKGLAESLQIGYIRRLSVEQYYSELLGEYSNELKPIGSVSSEMSVNQAFVDYVYSDEFKSLFLKNYNDVIENRNKLIYEVKSVAIEMEGKFKEFDISNDSMVVTQLNRVVSALLSDISGSERKIKESEERLKNFQDRKRNVEKDILGKKEQLSEALSKAAPRIKSNLQNVLANLEKTLAAQTRELSSLEKEKTILSEDVISEGANNLSIDIDKYLTENKKWIDKSVVESHTSIRKINTDIQKIVNDNKRLSDLLSVSIETVISNRQSEDAELSKVLTSLAEANRYLEELIIKKEKTESSWRLLGRAKRVAEVESEISKYQELIESYKLDINRVYDSWKNSTENNKNQIKLLQSSVADLSQNIIEQIVFSKELRLEELENQIKDLNEKIRSCQESIENYDKVNRMYVRKMSDDEILDWIKQINDHVPEFSLDNELQQYKYEQGNLEKLEVSNSNLTGEIAKAQKDYDDACSKSFSSDLKGSVNELKEKLANYSDLSTYQMIFDKTVNPFKQKNGIDKISGKYHRYDLYAELIFAKKYYGKNVIEFSFICVDEGQDLAVNEYRLLKELNSKRLVLNIFGDTNQLIKKNRGVSDWEQLKSDLNAEKFILNENYRNTNQITHFCNESFGMSVMQTGVDGVRVREITETEFEDELHDINSDDNRIAVLLPRDIPKAKYSKFISKTDNKEVSIMYVDEVKGIEFDKAYVLPTHMERNEKYIAYTRALSELVVVLNSTDID